MIVRIVITCLASCAGGFGYLAGLIRLTTGLLLGFGALFSFLFGLLFLLPPGTEQAIFPLPTQQPPLPYFLMGVVLSVMIYILFSHPRHPLPAEEAGSTHFTSLAQGLIGCLVSMFIASLFWFPSDELAADPVMTGWLSLVGSLIFLIGLSLSCLLLYRASRGGTERHPDLMRRFVLCLFAFFQLDKMPILVTYLLVSSADGGMLHAVSAAFSLAGYLPVAFFLVRTTWDCRGEAQDEQGFIE